MNGQGADADTLVASARAYVNALNKLLVKRAAHGACRCRSGHGDERDGLGLAPRLLYGMVSGACPMRPLD